MRYLVISLTALFVLLPFLSHAQSESQSDGELRGEILGEYGGEAIAKDHAEYDPEKAKIECQELFESKWRAHFDEMGFGSGPKVVDAFVGGCMKSYNEKLGSNI